MPGLCIDGVMYVESVRIVKMLADKYGASPEEMELINLVDMYDATILEAAKHWGWCGLHASNDWALVNKEHYFSYGIGSRDGAWERDTAQNVRGFLERLEAQLGARQEINGYYLGNQLTLADCVLVNAPFTLGGVAGVNLEQNYPLVHANHMKLREINPPGMEAHFEQFPTYVGYVQGANAENRAQGFDINQYW